MRGFLVVPVVIGDVVVGNMAGCFAVVSIVVMAGVVVVLSVLVVVIGAVIVAIMVGLVVVLVVLTKKIQFLLVFTITVLN